MAGSNHISTIAQKAGQNGYVAQTAPAALIRTIFGLVLMITLLPDILYLQKLVANATAAPDGRLSLAALWFSWIAAVAIMAGLTTVIHLWFKDLQQNTLSRLYFWLAMLALLVVTMQPLLVVLEQNDLAGSGFGDADATLGTTLAYWSSLFQIAALPICAIVGSLGLGLALEGYRDYAAARLAGRQGREQSTVAAGLLQGERDADDIADKLAAIEVEMEQAWIDQTHDVAYPLATEYEQYVEGKTPAPNRATFKKMVDSVLTGAGTLQSSELAGWVRQHSPELLPIEVLPQDGATLPAAAKAEIRRYARWIKRNYSRKALRAAL